MKSRIFLIGINLLLAAHTLCAQQGDDFVEGLSKGLPLWIRIGIAGAICAVQIILMLGTTRVAKAIQAKIHDYGENKLKPVKFKSLILLEPKHIISVGYFLTNACKIVLAILQLVITVPIVLGLFDETRNLANKLFGYIITPVKNFAFGLISYIPNIITIAISIIIARYALRGLKFFSTQIERRKLVIHGFYPEWAQPTFNILRVLIIAFTIAIIYPHLPNSESDVFKGVSVLVGVIFSLGSSSVVGNLISGIVMTYMRPFQVGDRIKINDVTGFVIERSAMVVRIRTHKNEIVSFPNQMIMNNAVTNYTAPTIGNNKGLIVHVPVTAGYEIPWQKVHEVLLAAAECTPNTLKDPPPFINHLKLDDYYCCYELNVYTKDVDILPRVYTNLYKSIQDGFDKEELCLREAQYHIHKPASECPFPV